MDRRTFFLINKTFFKGSTHITNSKEARTQRRQAILDKNECYEATEGILYGTAIADKTQVSLFDDFSFKKSLNVFFSKQRFSTSF